MKILITTDNIGGVWTYSLALAKGLENRGIDVCLAVIGEKLTVSQVNELGFTAWHWFESKQEWMDDPWADITRAGKWLQNLVRYIYPDIIHLNSYSFGALQWRVPVVVTAHSCVLSWWEAVRKEQAPPEWDRYRETVGEGLRGADLIVAPGNEMMKGVEKFYRPEKKKVIIKNGADSSAFYPAKKGKFIFSMGRLWDEAKNIMLVIEAAHLIGYPVYIAGEFGMERSLILPSNVHLLGKLSPSEIAGWLSKASVYLLPVKYEPFGYTFVEAAISGCALIAGDIPSMREVWGDAAVYADPDDSIALAAQVNDLMNNDNRREMLSVKARHKALADYTSEGMTSEYINLYSTLLQSSIKRKLKLQEQ